MRIFNKVVFQLLAAGVAFPSTIYANTATITIGELSDYVQRAGAADNVDLITQLIGESLKTQFALDYGIQFTSGDTVMATDIPPKSDKLLNCAMGSLLNPAVTPVTYHLNSQKMVGTISDSSLVTIDFKSLNQPIYATMNLKGNVNYTGGYKIEFRTACLNTGSSASGTITGDANVDITMVARIDLNISGVPVLEQYLGDSVMRYKIQPQVTVIGTTGNTAVGNISMHGNSAGVSYIFQGVVAEMFQNVFIPIYRNLPQDRSPVERLKFILSAGFADQVSKEDYLIAELAKRNFTNARNKIMDKLAVRLLNPTEYQQYLAGGENRTFQTDLIVPQFATNLLGSIISYFGEDFSPRFPVGGQYWMAHQTDIMLALLTGDKAALNAVFASLGACMAMDQLRDLPRIPAPLGSGYVPMDLLSFCQTYVQNQVYTLGNAHYSASGVSVPPTEDLGITELPWTNSPFTRADISPLSIKNNNEPYVKQIRFKQVNTFQTLFDYIMYPYMKEIENCKLTPSIYQQCTADIDAVYSKKSDWFRLYSDSTSFKSCIQANALEFCKGAWLSMVNASAYLKTSMNCNLEMRIYKKDIAAKVLKPMLAIHGGSFKYRGGGFVGLEALVSHFTERGFVVFAPFYRLGANADGPSACRHATIAEMDQDISDAFQWVVANKYKYGGSLTGKISLVGQSAGATLALTQNFVNQGGISNTLLMYPPTDMVDYITQVPFNPLLEKNGVAAILAALGLESKGIDADKLTLAGLDLTSPVLVNHSFPTMFDAMPTVFPPAVIPPINIIHGGRDNLVPARQSIRLCNALAMQTADSVSGPAFPVGTDARFPGLFAQYRCGENNGNLDILYEADHALEVCASVDVLNGVPLRECRSGGPEALAVASKSIENAYDRIAYCFSTGRPNTSSGFINSVEFPVGAQSIVSGNDNGFRDFLLSDKAFDLHYGLNTITLRSQLTSYGSPHWSVWIDFNHDGKYNLSSEKVFDTVGSNPIGRNFIIPATAKSGSTKMRIKLDMSLSPATPLSDPCDPFIDGEVENYSVTIH